MTAFVDTNVLVRHLTGDPPALAGCATAYLRAAPELLLTAPVVAETIHVLSSYYEAPRDQIGQAIRSLLALSAIVTENPARLLRAIEVFESGPLDFTESWLAASAERTIGR